MARHYYSTVNGTVTTFADIHDSPAHGEYITVHFERPSEKGFDIMEVTLPSMDMEKCLGFSEEEMLWLKRYALNNSALIWEIAREDGEIIADSV